MLSSFIITLCIFGAIACLAVFTMWCLDHAPWFLAVMCFGILFGVSWAVVHDILRYFSEK